MSNQMFLLRILLIIFCGLYKSYIEYRITFIKIYTYKILIFYHRSKKINFFIDSNKEMFPSRDFLVRKWTGSFTSAFQKWSK